MAPEELGWIILHLRDPKLSFFLKHWSGAYFG